ncbi:hypothetical protein [Tenacibaculum finnmarkense]|uniref:hypothetical protein n=1 Tax=Tenacibaculum finnmarkense TaxID=2781243 RepID=UPI001EFB977B|nr:hypothetical protein [Tenacibaculum finnmarkense]MCG8803971.1 hypothetical protein [Tenacibaculum finnmarkense]MCG8826694.1 hypothetical protein [Tenacibaculum finnmarkense]
MTDKKKPKISEKLTKKAIDERAEVLNPENPKYYKSRIKGLTDEQAKRIAELKKND